MIRYDQPNQVMNHCHIKWNPTSQHVTPVLDTTTGVERDAPHVCKKIHNIVNGWWVVNLHQEVLKKVHHGGKVSTAHQVIPHTNYVKSQTALWWAKVSTPEIKVLWKGCDLSKVSNSEFSKLGPTWHLRRTWFDANNWWHSNLILAFCGAHVGTTYY